MILIYCKILSASMQKNKSNPGISSESFQSAFESFNEMASRREREVIGNVDQAVVTEFKKTLSLFDFLLANIVADRNADFLLEKTGEVAW